MIEVNNLTPYSINKRFLKKIAEIILRNKKKNLSIALVGQKRIKELNKIYRRKNRLTDVLSFEDEETLGEIIICPSEVKKNAKRFNSSFKKELKRVLIHGILHLLGYDHEVSIKKANEMEKKQNYYLLLEI
jgi:probable rRNA maturation factor